MKLAVLGAVLSLILTSAYAAENRSELFYQPKAGAHSIEAGYSMTKTKIEVKMNGADYMTLDGDWSVFGLGYLYGATENMAVGLTLDTGTQTTKTTPAGGSSSEAKATGLGNITINGKGFSNMEAFLLRYGADLGISPGNKKSATATSDGNRYTGGLSLTPYVGIEVGDGDFHFGANLKYSYLMTRKTEYVSTTSEETGGNVITVTPYLEMMAGPGMLSASLNYYSFSSTEAKEGATTSTTPAYSGYGLGIAYGYELNPSITLIGRFDYSSYNIPQDDPVDDTTPKSQSFGIAGRFTF